jgi:response regulator RpfG family c-di-GMP phosphodiesterase
MARSRLMSSEELKDNGSILFVDDEISILNTLQRLFEPQNYTVYTASSAKDALAILSTHSVDMIVSDMRMPEMDGAAFLEIAAKKWPSIKRVLLTGFADVNSAISAINKGGIEYYLVKPWKNEHISKMMQVMMESKLLSDKNNELQIEISKKNNELLELNSDLEDKIQQRTSQLKKAYQHLQESNDSILQVLLAIVGLHEGVLTGHCRQIAEDTKRIAELMTLPVEQRQDIYFAAMMHNIGKVGLPTQLILKPSVSFNHWEVKEYRQYPILGASALSSFEPLNEVANIILCHREYYDGSGFPNKLAGDDIPVGARILAIVVDYHELKEGLIFPGEMSANLAINYMQDHASCYDPKILPLFTEMINASEQVDLIHENQQSLTPGQAKPKGLM